MKEAYRNIFSNLRKGVIYGRELDSLENGLEQVFDRVEFYEKLIVERDEAIESRNVGIKNLRNGNNGLLSRITEMQSNIDCLKTELTEVQKNKFELPGEPIKAAEMLIYATKTFESNSIQRALGVGESYNCDVYSKSDLKQIAEHLLVYCNNDEE